MKIVLARVGIDSSYGSWNAPVDPSSGEFVWVPFPEDDRILSDARYAQTYERVSHELDGFSRRAGISVTLPNRLRHRSMHLDPDFDHLTYGDIGGNPRGSQFKKLQGGDAIAFYAGLKPVSRSGGLYYGLIGMLHVVEVLAATDVSDERRHENAHTRMAQVDSSHVVVRGDVSKGGRLKSSIRIGEYRDKNYRVLPDVFAAWGGFTSPSDSIKRGVRTLNSPDCFLTWLDSQNPEYVRSNWD